MSKYRIIPYKLYYIFNQFINSWLICKLLIMYMCKLYYSVAYLNAWIDKC